MSQQVATFTPLTHLFPGQLAVRCQRVLAGIPARVVVNVRCISGRQPSHPQHILFQGIWLYSASVSGHWWSMSDEWQYGASVSGCLANALVGGNLHAFDVSFYQSKWQ